MTPREPTMLWPAPGSPALLEAGQRSFTAVLAHGPQGDEDLRAWTRELVLLDAGEQAAVTLEPVDWRAVHRLELEPHVRGFAKLPEAGGLEFSTCTLRLASVPLPQPPTTSRLFHVAARGRCLRPRSVAVLQVPAQRLSIAFACDIHSASFWDTILAAVRRHAPELAPRVLDPLRMWERFVADVNARWRDGDLDLVVLGGDLVDHVCLHDPPGAGDGETNVHRFLDALAALRPPAFVIPGNHDHRLFPWRPRVYGLQAIGLTPAETRRVLKSAGLWNGGPPRPRDLRALHTRDAQGRTALAHHLRLLAPATDFAVTAAGMRLVFASTGADAIVRWRSVEFGRLPSLLRSLVHSWQFPDSEGLSDEQLTQIAASLDRARGAAVFFHSPLLHQAAGVPIDTLLDGKALGLTGSSADGQTVERRWQAGGLRNGVCLHNAARLLERLLAAACPVATFSGHLHRATRIDVDRQARRLRSTALGSPLDAGRNAVLLTAAAVGQRHRDPSVSPGYLRAEFANGQLVRLAECRLDSPDI